MRDRPWGQSDALSDRRDASIPAASLYAGTTTVTGPVQGRDGLRRRAWGIASARATIARAPMSAARGTNRRSIAAVTSSADRSAAVTAVALSRVQVPTGALTVAGSIPATSETRAGRSPAAASRVRSASRRAGAAWSTTITATLPARVLGARADHEGVALIGGAPGRPDGVTIDGPQGRGRGQEQQRRRDALAGGEHGLRARQLHAQPPRRQRRQVSAREPGDPDLASRVPHVGHGTRMIEQRATRDEPGRGCSVPGKDRGRPTPRVVGSGADERDADGVGHARRRSHGCVTDVEQGAEHGAVREQRCPGRSRGRGRAAAVRSGRATPPPRRAGWPAAPSG